MYQGSNSVCRPSIIPSPSVITGDSLRQDLLLETADKILYILEQTIGFETNVKCNAERKEQNTPLLSKTSENITWMLNS